MTHKDILQQSIIAQLPLLPYEYIKKLHQIILDLRKEVDAGDFKNLFSEAEEQENEWTEEEWATFLNEIENRKTILKNRLKEEE